LSADEVIEEKNFIRCGFVDWNKASACVCVCVCLCVCVCACACACV